MFETSGMFIKGITKFLCNSLWVFGLWKPFNRSKLEMSLYCIYSVVFLFIFSLLYTFFMVCNIFFLTDFSDLTNRLFMSLTETALVIKIINFFVYNDEWQQINEEIQNFRIKSKNEGQMVASSGRLMRNLDFVYFFLTYFNVMTTALLSGLGGILLYSGWYPGFDLHNNRQHYWFIYGYQFIGMLITADLNLVIDSFYCQMILMTSTHLKIFGHRLSALQMTNDKNSIHFIRKKLIEEIHSHQRINANFELIAKNVKWSYFIQVLLSGIVMSSITISLARVNLFY